MLLPLLLLSDFAGTFQLQNATGQGFMILMGKSFGRYSVINQSVRQKEKKCLTWEWRKRKSQGLAKINTLQPWIAVQNPMAVQPIVIEIIYSAPTKWAFAYWFMVSNAVVSSSSNEWMTPRVQLHSQCCVKCGLKQASSTIISTQVRAVGRFTSTQLIMCETIKWDGFR